MDNRNKYHNYDLHPVKEIDGFDEQAWESTRKIAGVLNAEIAGRNSEKTVLVFELYPGVRKKDIFQIAEALHADQILDMEACAKPEEERLKELKDYITDDRVFGVICHKRLEDLYDKEKLQVLSRKIKVSKGVTVLIGTGAGLVTEGDIYVYCDITRWEIQLRYRAGMPNWNCTNGSAPTLTKVKIGFFIEWRLADRYKKERFGRFDYVLETEGQMPKMITGEAFRAGLETFAREPFRLEPYFDPGVWGGHWMQEHFDVGKGEANLAWSFDGVPEENAVNMRFGAVTVKIPAMDVTLYDPVSLLGERVYGRYGAEFPIRFDLLDTMGGGNLSLQVHPLTEYIQDKFGMHYTQDESYYLLDTDETEETYVYLGVQENVSPKEMEEELKRAQEGQCAFRAEKYVNRIPVKKHDHVLIPAGTVHCSGKNTMVLEISATPYIFTFKMWDWGRIGMDGLPRPIHVDHGIKNIQWERDTKWVHENLLHQERVIHQEEGCLVEKTGLHIREPIDTYRYALEKPYQIDCRDSVNVGNLVEGREVRIVSMDGKFEPFTVHYAETFIIPAKVGQYWIEPADGAVKVLIASIR